jgi:hypothetical protein
MTPTNVMTRMVRAYRHENKLLRSFGDARRREALLRLTGFPGMADAGRQIRIDPRTTRGFSPIRECASKKMLTTCSRRFSSLSRSACWRWFSQCRRATTTGTDSGKPPMRPPPSELGHNGANCLPISTPLLAVVRSPPARMGVSTGALPCGPDQPPARCERCPTRRHANPSRTTRRAVRCRGDKPKTLPVSCAPPRSKAPGSLRRPAAVRRMKP